jgi:hypothetical protein
MQINGIGSDLNDFIGPDETQWMALSSLHGDPADNCARSSAYLDTKNVLGTVHPSGVSATNRLPMVR